MNFVDEILGITVGVDRIFWLEKAESFFHRLGHQ